MGLLGHDIYRLRQEVIPALIPTCVPPRFDLPYQLAHCKSIVWWLRVLDRFAQCSSPHSHVLVLLRCATHKGSKDGKVPTHLVEVKLDPISVDPIYHFDCSVILHFVQRRQGGIGLCGSPLLRFHGQHVCSVCPILFECVHEA